MAAAKSSRLPAATGMRIRAKAAGYSFSLLDDKWELDKNNTVNVGYVASLLSEPTRTGFRHALAFYASELSAAHSRGIATHFQHMLVSTGTNQINDTVLINYRATLTSMTEHYLGTIRSFLRRWHLLGYPGVSKDVVTLLGGWTLRGNRKGDAVKRKDPEEGPLTDNELQAFNEGAVQAYERNLISLPELAMCLVTSNTGRRAVQISHLCVGGRLVRKEH